MIAYMLVSCFCSSDSFVSVELKSTYPGKSVSFLILVIMSNAILSIAGSIHQGHERFSDISRGRQCSFMIFSALLCAQTCPVRHWDTATVDQILIEGDRMFLNALENQSVPDKETLSLVYMPSQACWTVQLPMEVTYLKTMALRGKQFKGIALSPCNFEASQSTGMLFKLCFEIY